MTHKLCIYGDWRNNYCTLNKTNIPTYNCTMYNGDIFDIYTFHITYTKNNHVFAHGEINIWNGIYAYLSPDFLYYKNDMTWSSEVTVKYDTDTYWAYETQDMVEFKQILKNNKQKILNYVLQIGKDEQQTIKEKDFILNINK